MTKEKMCPVALYAEDSPEAEVVLWLDERGLPRDANGLRIALGPDSIPKNAKGWPYPIVFSDLPVPLILRLHKDAELGVILRGFSPDLQATPTAVITGPVEREAEKVELRRCPKCQKLTTETTCCYRKGAPLIPQTDTYEVTEPVEGYFVETLPDPVTMEQRVDRADLVVTIAAALSRSRGVPHKGWAPHEADAEAVVEVIGLPSLLSENARLREALEEIANANQSDHLTAGWMKDVARAALSDDRGEQGDES